MMPTWLQNGPRKIKPTAAATGGGSAGEPVAFALCGFIFCVTSTEFVGKGRFSGVPKMEKRSAEQADADREIFAGVWYSSPLTLRLLEFPRKEPGRCDELFLRSDRSPSVQRFLCLLTHPSPHVLSSPPSRRAARLPPRSCAGLGGPGYLLEKW